MEKRNEFLDYDSSDVFSARTDFAIEVIYLPLLFFHVFRSKFLKIESELITRPMEYKTGTFQIFNIERVLNATCTFSVSVSRVAVIVSQI